MCTNQGTLRVGDSMASGSEKKQRRGARTKAVLPVRIKGKDSAGHAFEDLVHTLDVNAGGVRLGSVRRELTVNDEITVFYRQRKMQFRVVWIKQLKGTSEFQAGLQSVVQEKDAWGVSLLNAPPLPQLAVSQASGVA